MNESKDISNYFSRKHLFHTKFFLSFYVFRVWNIFRVHFVENAKNILRQASEIESISKPFEMFLSKTKYENVYTIADFFLFKRVICFEKSSVSKMHSKNISKVKRLIVLPESFVLGKYIFRHVEKLFFLSYYKLFLYISDTLDIRSFLCMSTN